MKNNKIWNIISTILIGLLIGWTIGLSLDVLKMKQHIESQDTEFNIRINSNKYDIQDLLKYTDYLKNKFPVPKKVIYIRDEFFSLRRTNSINEITESQYLSLPDWQKQEWARVELDNY